jgi:D-tyrosyl-tRNA(Tyr) deacylase
MRAVVQRVRDCTVTVEARVRGSISSGLLVYLGVARNDEAKDVALIADKIVHLRIFLDEHGKMNLSAADTGAGILVVSQFTLLGDAREGRRPSWSAAAEPARARVLYEAVLEKVRASGLHVESGEFQAIMEVSYTNLGPITILLDSEKKF